MKISSPCHENYSRMQPADNGRFCASCEKVVIDFSKMSASQIADYFKNQSDEIVCGRFKSGQLNRGTAFEKWLWNLKQRVQERCLFAPARVVFVSILTGLVTLTSSCMGAVQREYPNDQSHQGLSKDNVKTPNNKPDTSKIAK